MEEVLKHIEQYATQAHEGQVRKYSNEPYIVHPVRVMKTCAEYTGELPVLAAALLHDVLEDTDVSSDQMREYLHGQMDGDDADRTLQLVTELTDVYMEEDYPTLGHDERKQREAERLASISAAAQTIKYADIIDNGPEKASHEPDALKVLNEYKRLLLKIDKGNAALYKRAMELVERLGVREEEKESGE